MSDDKGRTPIRVLVFAASLRAESVNAQLARLARKTGADKRFDFDMGAFEPAQFSYASRKSRTGQVLHDAEQPQPTRALSR